MRGIKVGSAFGIPIQLNWTFLLVLPLFVALIGWDITQLAGVLNDTIDAGIDTAALAGGWRPWVLGTIVTVGLFTGVLLHEFGHSLVALRYGYQIDSISLWLLGGMASFVEVPENWRHEFWVAVAGPLVSVGVGAVCYAGFLILPETFHPGRFVLGYLAVINVVLAVFNMLPAFPMDGGRVLRALLARTRPHARATQLASEVGKVAAFLLGIVGLFTNWFLILLALFIYVAASGEAQQTAMKAALEGVTVADIMTPRADLHTVSETTTVQELMQRMFRERHTGYPVMDADQLVGLITLEDAREVREVERDAYQVSEVMATNVVTVGPKTDAMEAMDTMQSEDVGRLPVVTSGGVVVGLMTRTDFMTAFNIAESSGNTVTFRTDDPGGTDRNPTRPQ